MISLTEPAHNYITEQNNDDKIEMTQNQVYGTSITGQGAEDEIKMTQNQVYGTRQGETDCGDITMQANVVYGVNEGSSQRNPNPPDEIDDSYDYI